MKVFISWSGRRSRAVARALRTWIPQIFPTAVPFMSDNDIPAGARWNPEIASKLEDSNFGILCVTPENTEAPWLMFEAGALAKTVSEARVCPYLIGLEPLDLPNGPLTQFHAQPADENGTFELVKSLNGALVTGARPESGLDGVFEKFWPDLRGEIGESVAEGTPPPRRKPEDMIAEILDIVRGLARRESAVGVGAMLQRLAQSSIGPESSMSDHLGLILKGAHAASELRVLEALLKGHSPASIAGGKDASSSFIAALESVQLPKFDPGDLEEDAEPE